MARRPAGGLLLLLLAGALPGATATGLDVAGDAVSQLIDAGLGSRKRLGLLRRRSQVAAAAASGAGLNVPSGGLGGEACFEANSKAPVMSATLASKRTLFDVYQGIFSDCGSGQYNMACVTNVFFASSPKDYLPFCQMSMSAQPAASGAVCNYAKARRDELFQDVGKYTLMASMMMNAAQNCKLVPLQCIMLAEECLATPDVKYCFNKCIRTGNMAHVMETTTMPPRAGMTAIPPLPTVLPVTTNLFIDTGPTTTLGVWDSILVGIDDALMR